MALVFFSGFETGDFGEWPSVVGTPTVVDTIKKTGDYAMYVNSTSSAAYVSGGSDQPRLSFYFNLTSVAGSTQSIIGGTAGKVSLQIDTGRHFILGQEGAGGGYDTGSTAIDTGVGYRISISVDDTNDIAKLYLNGVEECSLSIAAATSVINFASGIGKGSGTNTLQAYFDDIALDSTDSSTDLGDIRVLRASPNAAGQYAEFDTISGYTYCDEVPADGATTIVDDSGVSVIHRETYNLQDATTIGVGASDTIKAVNIWAQAYDSGNTAQGITVRDDGTDYETEALFGKAYTWKNKLYDTNAPRASAWTPAIFTAFQAGGYSEGSKDVYMSCVMVMVAYTPVGVTDYPISLSPGLTVSATVAYAVAWDRGMSPGLTATITIARALAYDRGTSPGLTVSATIAKSLGRLITTTANLTVSSAVARFMTYTRATPSNLTASVTVAKSFGKKIATTANLVVSTTIAMSKGFVRAVTSNLTASTTVDRAVAYNRASTPGLTVSATVDRNVTYTRATQPALSVAVSVARSFGRTITTTANLGVSVVVTAVKESGIRLARAWGIIFG